MTTRNILTFFFIVVFLIFSYFTNQEALQHKPYNAETANLYPLPSGTILKMVSMGQQRTLADFFWIKLVLTMGRLSSLENHFMNHEHHEEHHHGPETAISARDSMEYPVLKRKYPQFLLNYFYTISELDPQFAYPYHTTATLLLFDLHHPRKAKKVLDLAIKNNPQYWEFYFFRAFFNYKFAHAADSLVVSDLKKALKAPKSLRVFHRNMAFNLLQAYLHKTNKIDREIAFFKGLLETLPEGSMREQVIQYIRYLEMKKKNSIAQ